MNFKQYVPDDLRTNPAFLTDLRAVLALEKDVLLQLAKIVGVSSDISLEQDVIDNATKLLGDRVKAVHYAFTLRFLRRIAAGTDGGPEGVLADVEQLISDVQISEDQRAALVSSLEPSPQEVLAEGARNAFNFGQAYLGSRFLPIYVCESEDSSRLIPGASWSIQYRDSNGGAKALDLVLSLVEMHELQNRLKTAIQDHESRFEKLSGGR